LEAGGHRVESFVIDTGKILIVLGTALVIIGAIVWALGRAGFHGLPGDVSYEGRNVRIYFPIVSCIVLSILLTLGMWIWQWLRHR
jgi:hypothetical protein